MARRGPWLLGLAAVLGSPGVLAQDGPALAERARQRRAPRVLVEPLLGLGLGAAAAALTALTARAVVCTRDEAPDTCTLATVGAGYLGFLLGTPLGTAWAGASMDGLGSYASALLGTVGGVALAIPIALLARTEAVTIATAALPVVGAVVGYELRSNARGHELQAPGARLALAPSLNGGSVSGLTLTLSVTY
ncbi:MAG: hypothetical protein HY909_23530 [Deltaproteobacteria bacterium]|nr:hypothetical protein [Deltaproteobacteria bacterium]